MTATGPRGHQTTVLVTGATGFVGLNIVRCLAETGRAVIGLDLTSPSALAQAFIQDHATRISFTRGDVRNATLLARLVRDRNVQQIVHAAAMTPSPEVERERLAEVFSVNVGGTAAVFQVAQAAGVHRVVYVSSSRVYTVSDSPAPVTEDAPTRMDGVYAISKRTCEALAARYRALHKLDVVSVRVGWVYGPMETRSETRPISSAVSQMVEFALAGTAIKVDDLSCARDWTHAGDIGGGIAALLQAPRLAHDVYNLSSGRNATASDVLSLVASLIPGTRYRETSRSDANVLMRCENRRGPLAIGRLIEDTGFAPGFALASGLADYVRWYRTAKSAT